MAFTLDTTTKRGKVRLLIGDTDTVAPRNQIFSDTEIDAFLDLESNEVYAAAAAACRAIAASTVRSRVALRASGNKASDYRNLAKEFDERARSGDPAEGFDALDFQIDPYGRDGSEYVGDDLLY